MADPIWRTRYVKFYIPEIKNTAAFYEKFKIKIILDVLLITRVVFEKKVPKL